MNVKPRTRIVQATHKPLGEITREFLSGNWVAMSAYNGPRVLVELVPGVVRGVPEVRYFNERGGIKRDKVLRTFNGMFVDLMEEAGISALDVTFVSTSPGSNRAAVANVIDGWEYDYGKNDWPSREDILENIRVVINNVPEDFAKKNRVVEIAEDLGYSEVDSAYIHGRVSDPEELSKCFEAQKKLNRENKEVFSKRVILASVKNRGVHQQVSKMYSVTALIAEDNV